MNQIHRFTEHVEEAAMRDLGITATGDPQRTAALFEEMNEAIAREAGHGDDGIGRLPALPLEKAA